MSTISVTDVIIWILALVYFIGPGVLLAVWLFPDERPSWYIAVGGGIGIALLGLVALGLSYLPAGITRGSILVAIVVVDGFLAILLGWAPGRVLQRLSGLLQPLRLCRGPGWKGYLSSGSALLILSVFLLGIPYLSREGYTESYTEFYIVDSLLEIPPWRRQTNASEPVPLTFAVISHEERVDSFQVHVVTGEETLEIIHLGTMRPGASMIRSIQIPPRASAEQRYALILYKGNSETAYRTLSFWLHTPPGRSDATSYRAQPLYHSARR